MAADHPLQTLGAFLADMADRQSAYAERSSERTEQRRRYERRMEAEERARAERQARLAHETVMAGMEQATEATAPMYLAEARRLGAPMALAPGTTEPRRIPEFGGPRTLLRQRTAPRPPGPPTPEEMAEGARRRAPGEIRWQEEVPNPLWTPERTEPPTQPLLRRFLEASAARQTAEAAKAKAGKGMAVGRGLFASGMPDLATRAIVEGSYPPDPEEIRKAMEAQREHEKETARLKGRQGGPAGPQPRKALLSEILAVGIGMEDWRLAAEMLPRFAPETRSMPIEQRIERIGTLAHGEMRKSLAEAQRFRDNATIRAASVNLANLLAKANRLPYYATGNKEAVDAAWDAKKALDDAILSISPAKGALPPDWASPVSPWPAAPAGNRSLSADEFEKLLSAPTANLGDLLGRAQENGIYIPQEILDKPPNQKKAALTAHRKALGL